MQQSKDDVKKRLPNFQLKQPLKKYAFNNEVVIFIMVRYSSDK